MKKEYGTCQLCLAEQIQLVKSHIIPKAFYKNPINPTERANEIRSSSTRMKKSRTGVYAIFLCHTCEKIFMPWDDYAYKLFYEHKPDAYPFSPNPEHPVYAIYNNIKSEKLRLFFISLLWRASVCENPEYKNVSLGHKYLSHAKQAILNKKAHYFPEFDASFSRMPDTSGCFLFPIKQKFEGVNGYRICFPTLSCFIKIDQRPFPRALRDASLNTTSSVIMIYRQFNLSKEHQSIMQNISSPLDNKQN